MVHDARSLNRDSAFDFNSQAGVLLILQAIRGSGLPVDECNELRDLVFLYANGGGDPALRNVLEKRLKSHAITPEMILARVSPTVVNGKKDLDQCRVGFAGGRPAPVFTTVQIKRPLTANTSSTKTVVDDVPAPPISPRSSAVVSSLVPNKSSVLVQPSVPQSDTVSVPITQPIVPVSPKAPITKTTTPAITTSTSESPSTVVSGAAIERLERIRTIKADVNSRVGNPVNLIDIDNTIGHEYMAALLTAMKQLNSGPDAAIVQAMQRLEVVYEEVKTIVDATSLDTAVTAINTKQISPKILTPKIESTSQSPTPKKSPVTPVSLASPIQPVSSNITQPSQLRQSTTGSDMRSVTPSSPVSIPPTVPPTPVSSVDSTPVALATPPASKVVADVSTSSLEHTPSPLTPPPITPIIAAWETDTPTTAEAVPITSTRHNIGTESVADASPLRTPTDLPAADSLQTASVQGDPLYTKDIDSGLDQLLSEWVLFKKSGLFGTGPNGREHPLFKKIADLRMPLVLSGRFEGATPDIKQSITDYMNGWRYEQGVVYEKGETFDKYLRRVIRHIVDLQNKQRGT